MTKAFKLARIGSVLVLVVGLGGCAVEVENLKPAQELAQAAAPPGSIDAGWRVYQDQCARCHGPAASGAAEGPDLLPRVRAMSSRQFIDVVLHRYGDSASAAPRGSGPDTMPTWQGAPRVNAHIVDLYAYLSARAQGTQGPNRPATP